MRGIQYILFSFHLFAMADRRDQAQRLRAAGSTFLSTAENSPLMSTAG